MDSLNLTSLDAYRDTALRYRHKGVEQTLPHPRDLSVDDILLAVHAGVLREIPQDMEMWKVDLLFARWVDRHDLLDEQNMRRLYYLIDRYRREIEFDFRNHLNLDLGEMFRSRRWSTLLNYIDHLPRDSWYTETVSNDEEHAKMLAEAMADQKPEDYHPPLRLWSQEAALLADLVDAVRVLDYTLRAVNSEKKVPSPTMTSRPVSALDRAQKVASHESRKSKHESLVARMLPQKT